jgi:hypothetical protein
MPCPSKQKLLKDNALKSLLNKLLQLPTGRLTGLLTVVGVLIAMQINYIQHGWINNDSVLYFEAARLFSIGEWKASLAALSSTNRAGTHHQRFQPALFRAGAECPVLRHRHTFLPATDPPL